MGACGRANYKTLSFCPQRFAGAGDARARGSARARRVHDGTTEATEITETTCACSSCGSSRVVIWEFRDSGIEEFWPAASSNSSIPESLAIRLRWRCVMICDLAPAQPCHVLPRRGHLSRAKSRARRGPLPLRRLLVRELFSPRRHQDTKGARLDIGRSGREAARGVHGRSCGLERPRAGRAAMGRHAPAMGGVEDRIPRGCSTAPMAPAFPARGRRVGRPAPARERSCTRGPAESSGQVHKGGRRHEDGISVGLCVFVSWW